MSDLLTRTSYNFLQGGGEMGTLIRNYDWAGTSIGTPDSWPQSLRTTLGVILHSSFPMLLFWGPELICFYNDAYRPGLGNDGKHPFLLGKPMEKVWPELWDDIKPMIDQVINTGEAIWDEDRLLSIFRNGKIEDAYWTFSYSPVIDEEGKRAGVFVACSETTDKVAGTRKRKAGTANLKKLIQQAPVAITMYVGPEHIIQEPNQMFIEILGKGNDISGKPIAEVMPEFFTADQPYPGILKDVYEKGLHYKASGTLVPIIHLGVLQNRYYDFSYTPLVDEQGKVYAILCIAIDVTEQVLARKRIEESEIRLKRTAEELKNTNDRLQLVIDAGELGIFEADLVVNKIYSSQRHLEIFGFTEYTEDRSAFAARLHPDDHKLREIGHKLAVVTGFLDYTTRLVLPDGTVRWVRFKGVLRFDERKRPIKMLGVSQDVTDQKELEFQKDNFLGMASHELKTPVTSIKAYVQVMEDILRREGDPKYANMMLRIDKQVNRLNSLIADLLDVTKINSGKLQFNIITFNFGELMDEVIEDMQRISPRHTIKATPGFTGLVTADRERASQVITNLISNAIKYSPDADVVNVSSALELDEVVVNVQDFGIGIGADKQDKVFEQFYRVTGAKEHTFPGLGLGLYISSEIIKRMGGRIWVNSVEGKGSTFSFSFPVKEKSFIL